ncbi:hypothetical protein DID88_001854 [Monilinia fructigena]|uniref:Uncharacterized protein n=1 Tax=Monilinia fructigena TaxID=38457 RepID=A0A395IXA5_9HELO|nr:hypothetical protein DID88_001854 [Monilinia fructigena]
MIFHTELLREMTFTSQSKEQGKFLVTQRTEGVSTTGIITKIVRDYENRSGSPARMHSYEGNGTGSLISPSALQHLTRRLEIPRNDSPGPGSDFATGYSLGLIGMTRSRQSNRDSLQGSESSEEESDESKSPHGRSEKENFKPEEKESEVDEKQVDAQIDAAMAENAKKSGQ